MPADDPRVRVPMTKPVNLSQLDSELGGHGLSASETEIVVVEGSPVTAQQLTSAIASHDPDPDFGRDPDDVRREELADKAKGGTLTDSERDELLGLVAARI
jgi:hypothetical protein